jgi:hypothetical protein
MPGSFELTPFREVSVDDAFFDSLMADYDPVKFTSWYEKKSAEGASAYVYEDADGLGAFVYLKDDENEPIELADGLLPAERRLKIGTLKVADHIQGERLGEGAIGLALWRWRDLACPQIYVTVFEKHESLVGMLRRFGFSRVGTNPSGESVYLKDRRHLDFEDPYKCFPFIDPRFETANLLVIKDRFHDVLFPYSDLANSEQLQASFRSAAANGVTKMYISSSEQVAAQPGHPMLIYRKYTGTEGLPSFKSVITSYCVVTDVVTVKHHGTEMESFAEFRDRVKNKSVFDDASIAEWYRSHSNLTTIEMVYLGYFGSGNNVNWRWMKDNGYWPDGRYPHQFAYDSAELTAILREGGVNLADLAAHQS